MGFLKKFTKQEISWMMYDWANSAHSVIVVTILPIFFDSVANCTADVSSMSTWGCTTSIAMAIVALAAPFLGVFGDIRGMRKKLFTAFLLVGVVSVAGLAFTPLMDFTSSTAVAGKVAMLVLVLYILSTIGFDASCIYCDAFLTDVTTEDRMDSVSTLGYGLGYIGGSTIRCWSLPHRSAVRRADADEFGHHLCHHRRMVAGVQPAAAEKLRADHRQTLREGRHRRQHKKRVHHHERRSARILC